MNNLVLEKIELANNKKSPSNWEDFNEVVDVTFKVKGEDKLVTHKINVVSAKRVLSETEGAKYLRNCVVQEYFDIGTLKIHVNEMLKTGQFSTTTFIPAKKS